MKLACCTGMVEPTVSSLRIPLEAGVLRAICSACAFAISVGTFPLRVMILSSALSHG